MLIWGILASKIGDKECILIVWHDITKRKQAEKELTKYRIHLEHLVNSRTIRLEKVNRMLEREVVKRRQIEKIQNSFIKARLSYVNN